MLRDVKTIKDIKEHAEQMKWDVLEKGTNIIEANQHFFDKLDELDVFLGEIKDMAVPLADDWYENHTPEHELDRELAKDITFHMYRMIEEYAIFSNVDANVVKKSMDFDTFLHLRDQVLIEMASLHKRNDAYSYGATHELTGTDGTYYFYEIWKKGLEQSLFSVGQQSQINDILNDETLSEDEKLRRIRKIKSAEKVSKDD